MPQVGYVEYLPANIRLPIKLTPKSGLFTCVYAGHLYEDTQMQALQEKVLNAIKQTYDLTWTSIIELTLSAGTHEGMNTFFSLTKERKYITYHRDFGHKQAHWSATPDGRLPNSRPFSWPKEEAFIIPTSVEGYNKRVVYLPYNEITWEQIQEIESYLALVSQKLKKGFEDAEQIGSTLALCRHLFDSCVTQERDSETSSSSSEEE